MQTFVTTFEVPEEIAKKLSDLLTKQTIKERLLMQLTNEPEKFEAVEKMLIPITEEISALQIKITNEHIPEEYNSQEYIWNYDGWAVSQNKFSIFKVE